MIVYKIVTLKMSRDCEIRYESCRMGGTDYSFNYSKEEETVDRERGLFCFRSLPLARLFSKSTGGRLDKIFSAEAKGVRAIRYIASGDIKIWWEMKRKHKRISQKSLLVYVGTCLASHILLLEEVGR